MNPRTSSANEFAMFAIAGHIAGKSPEQIADEWMAIKGWNLPDNSNTAPATGDASTPEE